MSSICVTGSPPAHDIPLEEVAVENLKFKLRGYIGMVRLMLKRRSIIKGMTAFCGAIFVHGCELPRQKQPPPRKIRLGKISDFLQPSHALPLERLLIRRDQQGLFAMSIVCTHQTCIVASAEQDSRSEFVCPCHGSRFDEQGKVLQGPASRDLPYYELECDNEENLWVWLGKEVSSNWRLSRVAPG